jgi:hypothetical protein
MAAFNRNEAAALAKGSIPGSSAADFMVTRPVHPNEKRSTFLCSTV